MEYIPKGLDLSTRPAIRAEIAALRGSLPTYASWMIPELERISQRYAEILAGLCEYETFNILCREMMLTLPEIQDNVRLALQTQDWRPFNKAALALAWDMDELIRILG